MRIESLIGCLGIFTVVFAIKVITEVPCMGTAALMKKMPVVVSRK